MIAKTHVAVVLAVVVLAGTGAVAGLGVLSGPGTAGVGSGSEVAGAAAHPTAVEVSSPAAADVAERGVSGGQAAANRMSVRFDDQSSDGTAVTVESVTLPERGVIVVQSDDGGAPSGFLGRSSVLAPGTTEDVTISIDTSIDGSATLWAIAEAGDEAVLDSATISVSETSDVRRAIAGPDRLVDTAELLQAIQLWANDDPVPGTGGRTLDTGTLLDLIRSWAADEEVP